MKIQINIRELAFVTVVGTLKLLKEDWNMFNLPVEEVCSCAHEKARGLKSRIKNVELSTPPTDYERPVDFIEEWWRKSMIAANPETPDAVERFMRALSFDLRGRVADGFSEKNHIWYECHEGCCGSYGGSLAVYAAVAGCNLFYLMAFALTVMR